MSGVNGHLTGFERGVWGRMNGYELTCFDELPVLTLVPS